MSGKQTEHRIELNAGGFIEVDDYMQTSHPRIYAAGDVVNRPKLVYVAAAVGGIGIAAENALNGNSRQFEMRVLLDFIFTDPQVAMVGLTKAQAQASDYDVQMTTLPLAYVPRALAVRDTRGMIKLVADQLRGDCWARTSWRLRGGGGRAGAFVGYVNRLVNSGCGAFPVPYGSCAWS